VALSFYKVLLAVNFQHTNSPLVSSLALYSFSAALMFIMITVFRLKLPSYEVIKEVPRYLWVLGSFFSIAGLTLVYWLMPIMGVSKVMSGIIAGQMIAGLIVSHFGFFHLPVIEVNRYKVLGVMFLFAGVYLINWSSINETIK